MYISKTDATTERQRKKNCINSLVHARLDARFPEKRRINRKTDDKH